MIAKTGVRTIRYLLLVVIAIYLATRHKESQLFLCCVIPVNFALHVPTVQNADRVTQREHLFKFHRNEQDAHTPITRR